MCPNEHLQVWADIVALHESGNDETENPFD